MPQRNVATNFTFEQQRQEINLLAADFWTHKTTTDTAAPTYLKHDGSNDFTGQTLAVPNAFTINANSGSGTVTISGNLDVTGTTTTVSSANLEVTDKNILIAKGSTSDAQADGAGITIDSATDITFNFVDAKDALVSSIGLEGTTFLKAPYGHFIGSGVPSGGQGVEINAPDTNTGQIISYDRANTAYKELRVKGSSVGVYAGTANALVGSFSSTGLDVTGTVTTTGQLTGNSSNSGKYVRMYGSAGTGRWDIYGHNANLRFSDNDNAGNIVFDRNVEANGGLTTTTITASGDITASHTGLAVNEFESTDDHSRLRINSGNASFAQLEFGDQDDVDAGEIRYSNTANNSDYMAFHVGNNVEHMRLTQNGLLELLGVQRFQAYDNAGGGGGYNATGIVIGNAYDAGKTGLTDDRNGIIWQERGLDLDFATQDTFRMKLTYDGELLLGTQSRTDHKLSTSNNPLFQLESADSNDYGRMSLIYNGNNGVGPGFWFAKSRGTTIGSNVGVADGDQLGGMFFHAADGNDKYGRAAAIVCYADGTQGNNVTPGKLEFSTTQSGAAATTARMVIHNDGYITAPSQVGFAARMTSNLSHPGNNSFNSGTNWVMPFDSEIWDIGGNFNVSNYTFTAPVAGRYLCCYTIQMETISSWLWNYIYPVVTGTGGTTNTSASTAAGVVFADDGGTGVTGTSTTTASYRVFTNTIVMNLTAGQQVRMGIRGEMNATIKSATETQWTMQLLG